MGFGYIALPLASASEGIHMIRNSYNLCGNSNSMSVKLSYNGGQNHSLSSLMWDNGWEVSSVNTAVNHGIRLFMTAFNGLSVDNISFKPLITWFSMGTPRQTEMLASNRLMLISDQFNYTHFTQHQADIPHKKLRHFIRCQTKLFQVAQLCYIYRRN